MALVTKNDIRSTETHSYALKGLGEIRYVDLPRGYIKIINDFPQKCLIRETFPIIGTKYVHKVMAPMLMKVMEFIRHKVEYDAEWEYILHGSIFNPRHMWYHKNKPISMHAFAAAVDINPWENQPGTPGTIPQHIIHLFESNGFKWLGHMDRPDPMHFEVDIDKL